MKMYTSSLEAAYQRAFLCGKRMGCHQRPDRSFSFRGRQFPLCARCTGVMASYLLSIPVYILCGGSWQLSVAAMAVMLADWTIQFLGLRESTNPRRFLTGLCGGYGIMTFQLILVHRCAAALSGLLAG